VAALVPAGAGAAAINVTINVDNKSDDGLCTLREAVDAANSNAPVNPAGGNDCPAGEGGATTDFINLVSTGTYTLGGANGEDGNASGDLDFTNGGPVVVNGIVDGFDVPQTIIDAQQGDRIADLISAPGVGVQLDVMFQNVTLVNGAVGGGNGGGAIRIGDADAIFHLSTSRLFNNDAGGNGGAVLFEGGTDGYVFDVSEVEFGTNNADEEGGAIWIDVPQDSNATVANSAFLDNTAGAMGGAAYIESAGATNDEPVLQFENSTLSGNSAGEGGGAVAFDFGAAGTAYFKFTTIAHNTTPKLGGGGGVFTNSADQFVLFQGGTIIAGNSAGGVLSNCAGPGNFQTSGYNLDSGNSCHLNTASPKFDLINTNPLMGTSKINTGGKQNTETIGLYTNSPALDYIPRTPSDKCDINPFSVNEVDQRFVARPAAPAGTCDVGAFEGSLGAPQDGDGDTVDDTTDNCVLDENTNQANNDADFQGDACDPDDDNDAVLDASDNCPTQAGAASNAGCPASAAAPPSGNPVTPAVPAKKCKKKKKRHSASVAKKKCKKKKK
jgi:Thrombospondin type 3 repeat